VRSFGPGEPDWTRLARHFYYERRAALIDLEARICVTDAGLEWLMRVKRIGRTA
jgi:hypothetical protein